MLADSAPLMLGRSTSHCHGLSPSSLISCTLLSVSQSSRGISLTRAFALTPALLTTAPPAGSGKPSESPLISCSALSPVTSALLIRGGRPIASRALHDSPIHLLTGCRDPETLPIPPFPHTAGLSQLDGRPVRSRSKLSHSQSSQWPWLAELSSTRCSWRTANHSPGFSPKPSARGKSLSSANERYRIRVEQTSVRFRAAIGPPPTPGIGAYPSWTRGV